MLPHNNPIPTGLATSLTNALLSQPPPLDVRQSEKYKSHDHDIPSRKDARVASFSSKHSPLGVDCKENTLGFRKVSQPLSMSSGGSLGTTSQSDALVSSRPNSPPYLTMGTCSENLPPTEPRDSSLNAGKKMTTGMTSALTSLSGNSMEKGTKRARNFTPGSEKAEVGDEENQPRRISPRLSLSPFASRQASQAPA